MFGTETLVLAAFLAFCRIGGCFLVMPGLASVRVPVQVRLFIALAVSFALLFHLWDAIAPHVETRPDRFLVLIASELMIGALIGLMARIYVLAVQFIGSAVALAIGFNAMGGTAIEEPEPQAALTALISFSALLMLFVFDFHHEILRALVVSYRVAPVETLFSPGTALTDLADTISEAFYVMLQLGSPFLAYAILVNLAIGFVNKLTPQIPVYFISLPFVIFAGLALLYLGWNVLLSLFAQGFVPLTIGR
jgi:flagellar biosynthetic protein FliR